MRPHLAGLRPGVFWRFLAPALLGFGWLSNAAQAQSLPLLTPMSPAATLALVSQNANTPTSIDFVNDYGAEVAVYWIDYTGNHVFYASLTPGQSYVQATFLTHPWIIYDPATGSPIVGFLGIAQEAEALITNPMSAPTPPLQVSSSSLTFNATSAGDPPASQIITVISGGTTAAAFAVSLDGGQANTPAPAWLAVTPLSGTTPAALTVSVNPNGLNAGSFSGRILISGAGSAAPMPVGVTLTVATAAAKLSVAPASLSYSASMASPGLLDQVVAVTNAGSGSLSFSVSALDPIPWLDSITPSAGQTSPGTPALVHIRVNTNGLAAGGYKGTIQFLSPGGTVNVPISLYVSPAGPILGVDQTGVLFFARQGQGVGSVKTVQILNTGAAGTTVNFNAGINTSINNAANWLTVSPTSGTATTTQPGLLQLSINNNAQSLTPGGYYAVVKIADPNSEMSPQFVVVVLNVTGVNQVVTPDLSVGGLVFTGTGTQTVTLGVSSASPVTFTASATTTDGGAWLSAAPASGSVSTSNAAKISVATNLTGLKAGVYTGLVNIAVGSQVRGVDVTLIVAPNAAGASALVSSAASACTPTQVVLTQTGLTTNFSVPAGFPGSLSVDMFDNCANPLSTGSVFASFSNGDKTLSLHPNTTGLFSATWQPVNPTNNITITVRGSSGTLQPAEAEISGGVTQNAVAVPVLFSNATLNNYYPDAALSPGLIAQVYGSALATGTSQPNNLPLPTALEGTSVQIGPQPAPLYYVSTGQLNIEIPSELLPGQYPILVSVNGASALPQVLDINPVQAGIAAYSDGSNNVIAQHADFSYVTANHPANPGEVVIIYLAGMGATNPAVPSGQAAPTMEPLARLVSTATVTVDGQNATVEFAGLAPGFVGLYQIDLQVPANARTGSLALIVSQNGVAGNTTNLIVGGSRPSRSFH